MSKKDPKFRVMSKEEFEEMRKKNTFRKGEPDPIQIADLISTDIKRVINNRRHNIRMSLVLMILACLSSVFIGAALNAYIWMFGPSTMVSVVGIILAIVVGVICWLPIKRVL